jgi:hypothetical protein
MSDELPNDSDGDALRRLGATGSDLSKEMEIDFAVLVPDERAGLAFARIVGECGFRTAVKQGGHTGRWTCYCSRNMVPAYDAIVEIQRMLDDLGRPYNAKPDGWGSFGNAVESHAR